MHTENDSEKVVPIEQQRVGESRHVDLPVADVDVTTVLRDAVEPRYMVTLSEIEGDVPMPPAPDEGDVPEQEDGS